MQTVVLRITRRTKHPVNTMLLMAESTIIVIITVTVEPRDLRGVGVRNDPAAKGTSHPPRLGHYRCERCRAKMKQLGAQPITVLLRNFLNFPTARRSFLR